MKSGLAAIATAAAALLVGGCASHQKGEPTAAGRADWRQVATEHDRGRLRRWRSAFVEGLGKARAGHEAAIAAEGALLEPDAAIEWRQPPPGEYRCRVVKLGAKRQGLLDHVSYPPFTCRIRQEGRALRFEKLGGSQRPIGRLLPHSAARMVFLGTLQLGDETRALDYGRDRDRDMAGFLERIGERRWRLILPYPAFESTIDVVELVPTPS